MKLKNHDSSNKFLRYSSKVKSWHLVIAGVVLGAGVVLAVLTLAPGTAYAAGGVGSGGGGSGGSGGSGNWTYLGWGWSIYPTSGPGPTDGFKNGDSWASVQSTCRAAGAQQVYANIVNDSAGHGMVYDYYTYETVPYVYAGNFTPGTPVDGGRATATSTAQANAAFNTLGSYGVSTAGYAFGVNVGWFCFDYVPPTVSILGIVINGDTGQATPGVQVNLCDYTFTGPDPYHTVTVWTNSSGIFDAQVSPGTGLCVRVNGNSVAGTPVYILPDPGSLGFYPPCTEVGSPQHCAQQTYEAETPPSSGARGGYNFIYYPNRTPVGYLDTASCSNVAGWSFDPDSSGSSIYVVLRYSNGATQTVLANGWRPDVDSAYGIGGNHGFSTAPPESVQNSASPTTVYAYGVDAQTGQQVQLSASPKTIPACDHPPNGSTGTAACANPITSGTASDPDDPSRSIRVDIYVVGSGGPLPGYGAPGGTGHEVGSTYTSGGRYSYNLSSFEGYAAQTFYFYAIDVSQNGQPGPLNHYIGQVSFGNCAQPACLQPTIGAPGEEDNTPEPGKAFTVTATATWSPYNNSGTGTPPRITLSGTGVRVLSDSGPTYPSTGTPQPLGGTLSEQEVFTAEVTTANNYSVTETISGKSCGNSFNADNKPYLKVYGGDTMAGSGFASSAATDSCSGSGAPTPVTNAGAYAWNTGSSGSYAGSSTTVGSFAAYLVDGFASGNGTGASPPRSLTFANSPPGTYGYGGNFGDATCVPDYYTELSGSTYATNHSATITSYPGSGRAVYLYNGTNVSITNDVTMPTWTGLNDMPLFYVVVKGGNIYISKTVSELDGIYIAEPDSSGHGGNIYTCADGASGNVPNDLFSQCTQPLQVTGALIAKDVHFLRTKGTVDQASAPAVTPNCTAPDPNAAETICYLPSLWLANPFPASGSKLDDISSLPPVL